MPTAVHSLPQQEGNLLSGMVRSRGQHSLTLRIPRALCHVCCHGLTFPSEICERWEEQSLTAAPFLPKHCPKLCWVHESHNTALQHRAGQAVQSKVPAYWSTTTVRVWQEYKHRGTGELPDRITVRKLACIFMSKINFFEYVRKTSLQTGRHSILTKYIESHFHSYSQDIQLEGNIFTEITCCNQPPANLLWIWAAPHLAQWTIHVTLKCCFELSVCIHTRAHSTEMWGTEYSQTNVISLPPACH